MSSEILEKELDDHSRWVETYLEGYLEEARSRGAGLHPFLGEVYDSVRGFVLRGGKRIASYTTSLVYHGYGGTDREALRAVCAAIELYRHSILVHDDLVDGDELRRGSPTIHREYSDLRDERLGMGCAVFSGNILFSVCLGLLADSVPQQGDAFRLIRELLEANRRVNESQILDIQMEGRDALLSEWRAMASERAASLFCATLRMGGILAGADDDLDTLGRAGEMMGYVFDIQDDIIDTFASEEEYGRKPGSDLSTLKRPLHVVLALECADGEQAEALRSREADLESFRSTLIESGGLERAKRMAEEYRATALDLTESTALKPEAKDRLSRLMSYMDESLSWYV